MIVNDEQRHPESRGQRSSVGWTGLHSWIFLAIVACGLLVVGFQNRFHYLSPLGLGKAYRIDKLFGGIQEFDPVKGWTKAQLDAPPPQAAAMMPPGLPPSHPMTMNMPGGPPLMGPSVPPMPGMGLPDAKESMGAPAIGQRPPESVVAPQPAMPPSQPGTAAARELTEEERSAAFGKSFPDFGKDEFQLANDDLYPDWKKNVKPNGTWAEFLVVYGDFIQWWADAGQPPEPGFKLWKDFLKLKKRN